MRLSKTSRGRGPKGASAPLTIDEADSGMCQVLQRCNALGVPFGNDESLHAMGQGYQNDLLTGQKALHEGNVVVAGFLIEEVGAGQVGFLPFQGDQPAQAAHVGYR